MHNFRDNFACFSDKLHVEEVHSAISGILNLAKKQVKQNDTLDELFDLYEKARDKCLEDNNTNEKAKSALNNGNKGSDDKENEEAKDEEMKEDEPNDKSMPSDEKVSEANETPKKVRKSLASKQNHTPDSNNSLSHRRTRRTKK